MAKQTKSKDLNARFLDAMKPFKKRIRHLADQTLNLTDSEAHALRIMLNCLIAAKFQLDTQKSKQ